MSRTSNGSFWALGVLLASYSSNLIAGPLDNMSQALVFEGPCNATIASKTFSCQGMSFYLFNNGRANFTVALNDAADEGHVVSFSGRSKSQPNNGVYELLLDRMLLNSQNRPKQNGFPVPVVEEAAGICKQTGEFKPGAAQTISCTAMDRRGSSYSLEFRSTTPPKNLLERQSAASSEAETKDDNYIGKWYSEKVAACKTEPGTDDNGLIAYTQRKFIGYESSCNITKVVFKGRKAELTEQCAAEGETSTSRETLEILDGKLKRSWRDGRKSWSFTYSRCP